jgi:hypothetical protein
LKQLFFFFHVAIMSRSSADLLVNKSVLFDPLERPDKPAYHPGLMLNQRTTWKSGESAVSAAE